MELGWRGEMSESCWFCFGAAEAVTATGLAQAADKGSTAAEWGVRGGCSVGTGDAEQLPRSCGTADDEEQARILERM